MDRLAAAQGSAGDEHEQGSDPTGATMSDDGQEFWSTLSEKVSHPARVPIIEALWRIGEPLSAIALVDVLDGHITMWQAAHHLRILDALGVVAPSPVVTSRKDSFDVPYFLRDRNSGEGA